MLRYLRYTILIYYGFKLTFAHACSCQTHNPQEINIKNFSNFALYAFRVPLIYYFLLASLIEDNARPSCCLLALYIYACTSSLLPFLWWEGLINIGYVIIKILKLNLRSFWIKKKNESSSDWGWDQWTCFRLCSCKSRSWGCVIREGGFPGRPCKDCHHRRCWFRPLFHGLQSCKCYKEYHF